MGSSKETTTQTNTIPGVGAQEGRMRDVLGQLASGVQMGDISNLTSGNLQITAEDRALIEEISKLSQRAAGDTIRSNAADTMGAIESNALDRGIGSSTIESVNKAVGMRQMQQSLDQSAITGQVTNAQQLREQALSRAGIQLNANQLLLQRILGGAQSLAGLGLQERLAQGTTTEVTEKPFDWAALMSTAGDLGEAAMPK
jgi:hypothetical protein